MRYLRCIGPVVLSLGAALPWACSSTPECSYDIDCPGRMVCSAEGACVERPEDAGAPVDDIGENADSGGSADARPKDGGWDAGRDAGDAGGDAGADAGDAGRDAGDAGKDGGDSGDGGLDAGDAGKDGGDGGCGECGIAGERACDGTEAYRICEQSGNSCLTWGARIQCVDPDECRQGTCGHDACAENESKCEGNDAYRVCSKGNSPFLDWGDPVDCGPGEACGNTFCCPSEMAEAEGFCIDRYEAFASSSATCGLQGTAYGWNGDDYPLGFPDKVGDGGLPETEKVYSCAAQGVKPSAFITFFQAGQVCRNSGKHLCTAQEWYTACAGPGGLEYPYGDTYEAAACNTSSAAAVPTGSLAQCTSGFGAFDMSGNLYEWVFDDARALGFQPIAGGAYNSGDTSSCDKTYNVSTSTQSPARGWRCCKLPQD